MKINHSLNCFLSENIFWMFSEPGKGKKDPRKNIGRGKTKIVGYGEHFPGVFGENEREWEDFPRRLKQMQLQNANIV